MTEPDPTIPIDEAARWAVRLDAGPLSTEEQHALDTWLAAGSGRRGALLRAQAAWVGVDRVAALRGPPDEARHTRESSAITPLPSVRWPITRRQALAASIAFVAAGGLAWWILGDEERRYASDVGEVRRVPLPDGSTLQLNTSSAAVVRFDERTREVALTAGEALFEVVKDPTRPFVVRAPGVSVTAVGTAFAVRVHGSQVRVTVSEGVVAVTPQAANGAAVQMLKAEEQAVTQAGSVVQVRTLPRPVVERQLSWIEGTVAFDGESLAEAAAEINRHARVPIVIADDALARRPVVGVFRATDTEGFAQAAAAVLGADVRLEDGRWVLSSQ